MIDLELYAFINAIERRVLNACFMQSYKFKPYEIEYLEWFNSDANRFVGEISLLEQDDGSFLGGMSVIFSAELRGHGVDIDIFYESECLRFGFYIAKFLTV